MHKTLTITIFALLMIGRLHAQSTINLMSGKTLDGNNISIGDEYVEYDYDKKGSTAHGQIEIYRVFSVTDSLNNEQVIYTQDSTEGRLYSVENMKYFIYGEQDAEKTFKSPATTIVAGAVGVANGVVFTWVPVLTLPVIFVTSIATSAIPAKINPNKVNNKEAAKQPAYHDGYKRVAKSKKLRNGALGSVTGTVLGLVAGRIIGS